MPSATWREPTNRGTNAIVARYLIGIDLGTTNSAVAYVDPRAADPRVRVFEVAQLVAPGEVFARPQLPSFVYLAGDFDLAPHETALPWRPVARIDRDPQAAVVDVRKGQLVGREHPARGIEMRRRDSGKEHRLDDEHAPVREAVDRVDGVARRGIGCHVRDPLDARRRGHARDGGGGAESQRERQNRDTDRAFHFRVSALM